MSKFDCIIEMQKLLSRDRQDFIFMGSSIKQNKMTKRSLCDIT